jgi:flagellar basal body rod protein FlgG
MSGAQMQDQRLESLSNNLANALTPGFKRQESVYRQVHNDATKMGDPNQAMGVHHPVRFLPEDRLPGTIDERWTHWSQGPMKVTNNPLDVAIEGEGFLTVQGPNNEALYTRNGGLRLSTDGTLVNVDGLPVLDDDGKSIQVVGDSSRFQVTEEGFVQIGDEPLGRLGLVTFDSLQPLERLGGSLFRQPDPAVAPRAADAKVLQGHLEGANVNPVWTMTMLIKTNRIFELNVKAMQAYKNMDDSAIRDVGRD